MAESAPSSGPFWLDTCVLGTERKFCVDSDRANFCSEVLTFEVVDFPGSYHAILGRSCYAKFMAIPNYTYLKLKMPGPNGVITMSSAFSHAFECDREPTSSPPLLSTHPSSCSSGSCQPQRS